MKPEGQAREKIDQLLTAAGWAVQDYKDLNLGASLGVAVREFPLKAGFADYLLFLDRKAAGALEAKPVGTTLSIAEFQSEKYQCSLPEDLPCFQNPREQLIFCDGEPHFSQERWGFYIMAGELFETV